MSPARTTQTLSLGAARRIALAAQGFADARPRGRIDRRHLRKVMDRLQLLQLDSVPVVIRTQYMPLFSRLGPYRAELLDEVAYRPTRPRSQARPKSGSAKAAKTAKAATYRGAEHVWFEAWSHEASLLPVETEPWLRWSKEKAREGATWGRLYRVAQEDPGYIEAVLSEIKARGPIAAGELTDPRPHSGDWWGSRSSGALALDWLFRIGEVGVRRRPGFVKEFDLLERIVPDAIRARPTPSFEASLDELLMRSARAHGIASADCLVDYFRLPVKPAKARLEGLVEEGRLERCQIEGWRTPALLDPKARRPRAIRAAALLSPFDPLVWRRKRIEALFDFDYKIEIYTPAAKRRWGYYVLPFLMDERLAGRFDLKTDRATGTLEVRAAHLEEGLRAEKVAKRAAGELVQLARMVGAERVRVGRRGNLARALSREVAATPGSP